MKQKEKKVRVTITLTPKEKLSLQKLARANDKSLSSYIASLSKNK